MIGLGFASRVLLSPLGKALAAVLVVSASQGGIYLYGHQRGVASVLQRLQSDRITILKDGRKIDEEALGAFRGFYVHSRPWQGRGRAFESLRQRRFSPRTLKHQSPRFPQEHRKRTLPYGVAFACGGLLVHKPRGADFENHRRRASHGGVLLPHSFACRSSVQSPGLNSRCS